MHFRLILTKSRAFKLNLPIIKSTSLFSSLTLLVGWQEGHPAYKITTSPKGSSLVNLCGRPSLTWSALVNNRPVIQKK